MTPTPRAAPDSRQPAGDGEERRSDAETAALRQLPPSPSPSPSTESHDPSNQPRVVTLARKPKRICLIDEARAETGLVRSLPLLAGVSRHANLHSPGFSRFQSRAPPSGDGDHGCGISHNPVWDGGRVVADLLEDLHGGTRPRGKRDVPSREQRASSATRGVSGW